MPPSLSCVVFSLEQINPFAGVEFTASAIVMGCLGALPIFLLSVLLEKSGVEFFRKIDQDTKLYVVQVFGAERNWPVRVSSGFVDENCALGRREEGSNWGFPRFPTALQLFANLCIVCARTVAQSLLHVTALFSNLPSGRTVRHCWIGLN